MVIIYNPEFDLVDKQYTKIKKNSKLLIPTAIGATSLAFLTYMAYKNLYKNLIKSKLSALIIDIDEDLKNFIYSCFSSFLNINYEKYNSDKTNYDLNDKNMIIIMLPLLSEPRHNFREHKGTICDIIQKTKSYKIKYYMIFTRYGNNNHLQGIDTIVGELEQRFNSNLKLTTLELNMENNKCIKDNLYNDMKKIILFNQ